ncbi:cupredoxin domain-containing protein [Halorussus halophilus]|uniref:cupredoxin domain-containing protein n=1 Tax=Halorussus halophilus TaxID=2650975 RepID=UPI0013018EAB|nr:plastocyanin/azurin family copper-binding protein [Halorussus halophilus]
MTRETGETGNSGEADGRTRRKFIGAVAAGGVLASIGTIVGGQETTTGQGTTTVGNETATTAANQTETTVAETTPAEAGTTVVDQRNIALGARQGGWRGREPESIRRQRNPPLALREGQTYRVTWRNLDGLPHNFSFFDDQGFRMPIITIDGEEVRRTPVVSQRGATQTFEFTADPGIEAYICNVHPLTMRGNVFVWTGEI